MIVHKALISLRGIDAFKVARRILLKPEGGKMDMNERERVSQRGELNK